MEMKSTPVLRFISAHEGFQGRVKHCPGDFVVIEINVNGDPVTATQTRQPCAQGERRAEKEQRCAASHRCMLEEMPIRDYSDAPDPSDLSSSCGAHSVTFDLEQCLGQATYQDLESLATSSRSGQLGVSSELCLGTFPEKLQRTSVHRAIRHSYPHLMTLTSKTEIRVKEDPEYRELSGLVTEDESQEFFRFIDAKVPDVTFTFRPDDSKEHRKAVHHFLSKRFGKLVETKTLNLASNDGQPGSAISVRFRERGKPSRKRKVSHTEGEDVVYTAFTLKKENLETLEAISYMAAELGILPSDFTYAGIKDKRAITYQSMVVKKVSPQRLEEKSCAFERRGMTLSHLHTTSQPLRLGRLQGNRFQLLIRDVRPHSSTCHDDVEQLVQEALFCVGANGFVNYYGPQRFGSGQSVQADRVGLALLKQDMVEAVRLFFTPEEGEELQNRAKQHFLKTGNAKESLALMPEHKARERLMLRALHRYGNGPDGSAQAWLSLPHGMRVFPIHAYCSRVWNEAATYRLREMGHRAVQGDLVWEARQKERLMAPQVHVVSAEEEVEGVYSLTQVILPMPGNTVKYPENALGAWYRERLAADGLRSCPFRISSLKLNVPGCYRPLLAFPRNITHQLHGDSASLALTFDLDSSCYATVCLREIMKCDC